MTKTGELAVNFDIWQNRPHRCQNLTCTKDIHSFNEANFHHLISKGTRPDLRLVKEIIILLCFPCHDLAHREGNSALDVPPEITKALEKYGIDTGIYL